MSAPDKQKQSISQWVLLLLLCSVFTLVQAATLEHSVEHLHHDDSVNCEVCVVFCSLGLAYGQIEQVDFYQKHGPFEAGLLELFSVNTHYLTLIRAPPFLI